jgi:hypothetical protein
MRFFLSYLCIVLKNNGVITKAGGNRPYERLATPYLEEGATFYSDFFSEKDNLGESSLS